MSHQFSDSRAGLERFVRISLLFLTICPPSLAQTDVRLYRAPNHIVMALRHLLASDSWTGMLYTEGTERYAVVSWGSSCAVSANGYLVTANHVVKDGERYIVGGWDDTKKLVVAEVVRRDEKADLAVIKVDPPNQVAWIKWRVRRNGSDTRGDGSIHLGIPSSPRRFYAVPSPWGHQQQHSLGPRQQSRLHRDDCQLRVKRFSGIPRGRQANRDCDISCNAAWRIPTTRWCCWPDPW